MSALAMKQPKIWVASIRHEYDQNNGNECHVQDQKNHRGVKQTCHCHNDISNQRAKFCARQESRKATSSTAA
jgi:hypothetical protein